MWKYIFILILLFHGIIHYLGFAKAFDLSIKGQLKSEISQQFGIAWLIGGLAFILLAILYFFEYERWHLVAFGVVALSQVLVFSFWKEAKAATIANLIVFSVAAVDIAKFNFVTSFEQDVSQKLETTETSDAQVIGEEDLIHLPVIVAKYLRYVGVVGHPKLKNISVAMRGEMRGREGAWFQFESSQYNFFQDPSRFFFMKAKVTGLPAYGYHSYDQNSANMQVRMMALFPVVDEEGEELFRSETVTYLNDLCIMAPAALIFENITWVTVSDTIVEATLTRSNIKVSAFLCFNQAGQLTNFISDDRYDIADMKKYRFSTPVKNYRNINGFNLPSYGEAIWHYPDGEFVYGKFDILEVDYNVIN